MFITSDTTTFATGSKDTLPIADWQCNFDNNVNSKIDVMNAYAATYNDPVSGDEFLYFGLERNTNTGTADVGFWFLQEPVACASLGGAADFVGSTRTATCWSCPSSREAEPSARSTSSAGTATTRPARWDTTRSQAASIAATP